MSVNSGIKLQTAFLVRMYASALVHRPPCLQVGVYIRTHMCIYIYGERGMHTFMEEMTLVIGPYMEQKTRPMEQIIHCKSCSLRHCEASVDKLRASSGESSPLPPVPMLMSIRVGSSCAHNIGEGGWGDLSSLIVRRLATHVSVAHHANLNCSQGLHEGAMSL